VQNGSENALNTKSLYIRLSLTFVLAVVAGMYLIAGFEQRMKHDYLQMQSTLLQGKYSTNYKYFKLMSDDIFAMLQDNKTVVESLGKSRDANAAQQAILRQKLFKSLKKRYHRLENMGVMQLQFHTPDSHSFLRMNNPTKFGDDLSGFRHSVVHVNNALTPVQSFEFGRTVYGFRFVYPLFDADRQHIGSVGISYSSEKLLEMVVDSFINDVHFVVSKKLVEEVIWDSYSRGKFKSGWESPDYLHDVTMHKTVGDVDLCEKIGTPELAQNVSRKMATKKPFAVSTTYNFNLLVLNFMPLIDPATEDAVAYMILYSHSDYLQNLERDTHHYRILFITVILMMFLFGLYIVSSRHQLYRLAHNDALTQLPNRRSFYDECKNELHRAKNRKSKVAMLFIDLDKFKPVNDRYGHKIGDDLLVGIAKRVKNQIRQDDVAARLGGDEFAVLLCGISKADDARHVAQKIVDSINEPFAFGKITVQVGASIGVSVFPDHTTDMDMLVSQADTMMYEAKNDPDNSVKVFGQ
jgi:diguanylate cyclase (GGDEF)-like protein